MRLARQINGRQVEFAYLSDHPDLTAEVIAEYPVAQWDWESIMNHDNMCFKWLETLPDAPWEWGDMTSADRWSFDWVRRLPEAPWHWWELHHEDSFDVSWVAEFPDKPWNMESISKLASIELLYRYPQIQWNWAIVTSTSPVKPSEMVEHPGFPWDFSNFGFDVIDDEDVPFLRFFQERFDDECWMDFTEHAEWETIRKNADLPWSWSEIEPDEMHPEDIQILRDHASVINWKKMSLLVPYQIIKRNLDLPWNADWVSMNETLEWHDIDDTFDWDYAFVPCEPKEVLIRRWTAANLIKRRFKVAISDPDYWLCRRRILREGHELSQLRPLSK